LAVREFIDKNVKKEKFQPRYHAPPKVSATNLGIRETTVQYNQHSTWGRVQCPWCKESTIAGKPAITCAVWPHHNWTYKPDVLQSKTTSGSEGLKVIEPHQPDPMGQTRVVDTRRMPPDVFRTDRYFHPKEYLHAVDPYRKTTPVSHKINFWKKKYGTEVTVKYDNEGYRVRRLNGYQEKIWMNHENYLFNDKGVHVVYTAAFCDIGAGASSYWGPAFFESEAVPMDEITLEDSESYAIAMALDHAKSLGISKLEIRTDSKLRPPDGAQAPNGIEVNFVSIEDPSDKGFDMASELAYQGHIEHIELQKAVANKA